MVNSEYIPTSVSYRPSSPPCSSASVEGPEAFLAHESSISSSVGSTLGSGSIGYDIAEDDDAESQRESVTPLRRSVRVYEGNERVRASQRQERRLCRLEKSLQY